MCCQLLSRCFRVTARDSFRFFSFFFLSFCVQLSFLTLFLWLLLFLFPVSRYSMSLPSSFCVSTPLLTSSSSPPFSLPPSWQQCQSRQADRGKHSTGQSRGRSKGWRIDYVYVCVLKCPLSVCLCVCLRSAHTQLRVMRVYCESVVDLFSLFVVHSVFDTVACVRFVCML